MSAETKLCTRVQSASCSPRSLLEGLQVLGSSEMGPGRWSLGARGHVCPFAVDLQSICHVESRVLGFGTVETWPCPLEG